MSTKNENVNSSADLNELDDLNQDNRISPLDFKEPELHDFDAASIFELDESQPEKKSHRIFGKRSSRRANVKIKENLYEDEEVQQETAKPAVTEKIENTEETKEPEVIEEAEESAVTEEAENEKTEEAQEVAETEENNDVVIDVETMDEEEAELDEAMEEALDEMEDDSEEEEEEEEEEEQHKGLYDGEDLDLFEDKKHFFLSQYSIVEEYLHEQSNDGYHFVRHEGKKYYFVEGQPANYYYSIDYFRDEPSDEQWQKWEKDGWKLISKEPGKRKKDLGWLIFRNLQKEGEYKKEIDNDEEKYRFFKKYANSCRSTLFLIFICMFCCIITGFLQFQFHANPIGIGFSAFLFLISFILFCSNYRMLRHAKKRVRLLKARLRVKESNRIQIEKDEYDISETEAELETDWNTLSGKEKKKKKRRKRS